MFTGQPKILALSLIATGLLAGCAQTDAILPRRTTLGTLKTSVSHLQFENEKLRREVAQLKTDNREIADRLDQEENANGLLTAKLNDAKYELGRRGLDTETEKANVSSDEIEPKAPSKTLRAGRSTRKARKPPFTRIPGRLELAPSSSPDDDAAFAPRPRPRDVGGPKSEFDNSDHWLPIAQGTSASTAAVR